METAEVLQLLKVLLQQPQLLKQLKLLSQLKRLRKSKNLKKMSIWEAYSIDNKTIGILIFTIA
jgi:hypothetical protein